MSASRPFAIAAVQASPVFLDLEASVDKACDLIRRVGASGGRLAVFPEAFLPGFPVWVWFVPAGRTRELRGFHTALARQSVTVPGPVTERLGEAAREAGVGVVMGVNERDALGGRGTLYDTLLFFAADGRLVGRHRKLVPTTGERLVWGQGDGSDLGVHDLGCARVSGLLCWENYMPLARYAHYAWGAEIHAAPTFDRGEPWLSTLRHVAKEGRVYVVGCASPLRRDDLVARCPELDPWLPAVEWPHTGDSAIVDPDGKFLVEPVREREEILLAEVDPAALVGPKFQLDVTGHYGRLDLFELSVRRHPVVPLREIGPPASVEEAGPEMVRVTARDGERTDEGS